MEQQTIVTAKHEFTLTITRTETVSIEEAIKYHKSIFNPAKDIDVDTEHLMDVIIKLNEMINNKQTTPSEMMKKIAALINQIPPENIALMVAMLIEVLANQYVDKASINSPNFYQNLRHQFLEKIVKLPSNETANIPIVKQVESKSHDVNPRDLNFEEWEKLITPEEREKIMTMTPHEAIEFFNLDCHIALQRLKLPNNTYREKECTFRLTPNIYWSDRWTIVDGYCRNKSGCTFSHHPLTRAWINAHYDDFLEYLENACYQPPKQILKHED